MNNTIKIPGLDIKFDICIFSHSLAIALDSIEEAIVLQRIYNWLECGYGTTIGDRRWIYKSIASFKEDTFPLFSEWKLRQIFDSLVQKKLLIKEQLNKKHFGHNCNKENRRYYYTIAYSALNALIQRYERRQKEPLDDLLKTTDRRSAENQEPTICELSQNRSRNTSSKETITITQSPPSSSDVSNSSNISNSKEREKIEMKSFKQPQLLPSHSLAIKREQLKEFRKQLTEYSKKVAYNPAGLVDHIINKVRRGEEDACWSEFLSGVPLGSSIRQEWEIAPGEPYPKFIEFMVEKLRENKESREQTLYRIGGLFRDKVRLGIFWQEFKRNIEILRQDGDRLHQKGKQVPLPTWFVDRANVSVDRAVESAQQLEKIAPVQKDFLIRQVPELEEKNIFILPAEEITPNPDFCFNGFIDLDYLVFQAEKIAARPETLGGRLLDFRAAFNQATPGQRLAMRSRIDPICPLIFQELEPSCQNLSLSQNTNPLFPNRP